MDNYRLGLDVGTNSLGWSVLKVDKEGVPYAIVDAGARIFSDGRDSKSKSTLAANRREARSARRRRDRFKQRQAFLLAVLTEAGLFPEGKIEREALRVLNPLELRTRALTEKLKPHHIGRALFHLNQRRGFKSNRKDRSDETTSGMVSNSARKLLEEMKLIGPPLPKEDYKALPHEDKKQARQAEATGRKLALEKLASQKDLTYGSFLYARHKDKNPTRARPGAGDDGKLYDVYPTRELYEDEFNKIWDAQARHHSTLTDTQKKRIHYVIFTQRPLKPQKRGYCAYMPNKLRTFRAMPSFQRFRIYQEVNNLEWTTSAGKNHLFDYLDARNKIVDMLERTPPKDIPTDKNGQIGFAQMKKVLKNMDLARGNFTFNFETPKRKGFDGNLTSHVMQHEDYVGSAWHDWDLEKQDRFIGVILDDKLDDEEVKGRLMSDDYGLSEHTAENCMNAPLIDGTASVSRKAAQLMMEAMRDGVENVDGELIFPIQSVAAAHIAVQHSDFIDPFRRSKTEEGAFEPLPALPYYGEAFQDGNHIIPGDRDEIDRHDDRKYYGGVTNPTVHIALNQIRQVVNELIGRFGHPASISIELGRELPEGAEKRNEIEREQKKNQDENERLDKILREHGKKITRDDRLRLRLWEELDKDDPLGRRCPFSGQVINLTDLFNGLAEIEHLIPFSISLDDSRANKVICTREANKYKGNLIPYKAFEESRDGYNWDEIFERAKRLPKSKQWRFQKDALEIWKRDFADFTDRHLNDTRYIGRLTREYLENICHIDKIDVLTGRLTSLLRGHWGLNSVLRGDNLPEGTKKKKNRDDHRHHAVDAIVIGMTTKSILQRVATQANKAEELKLDHMFLKGADGKSAIDPDWVDENGQKINFRDAVRDVANNIIVSHKAKRKNLRPDTTDGQLHNETALGLIEPINETRNEWRTVVRRSVYYLEKRIRVEAIRDCKLRAEFLRAFDEAVAVGKKGSEGVLALGTEKGIRRLRCFGPKQAIPIKDKDGKTYKGYQSDKNWGVEIYAFPEDHKKADKWEGVVVSRFDANRHDFQPGMTYRPHPAARLIMRLQINDCIEIEKDGRKRLMRLQLTEQSGNLVFAPLNEANVDARNRDKEDDFKYFNKTANTLKPLKARKVHISPTGQVNYENRSKPRREKK